MSVGDQMYPFTYDDEAEETTPESLKARAYILRYQPRPDEESAKSLDAHADAWAAQLEAERGISGDLAIEVARMRREKEADRRRLEALERKYKADMAYMRLLHNQVDRDVEPMPKDEARAIEVEQIAASKAYAALAGEPAGDAG